MGRETGFDTSGRVLVVVVMDEVPECPLNEVDEPAAETAAGFVPDHGVGR